MPLQASGKIRLSDVAAQFGSSGSIKMSDYLKGGSKVADTSVNTNVASSGKQELSDYYSTGNPVVSVIATMTGNQAHYFNGTINTVSAERGANTRLIMAGCGSAGSGNVTNNQCSITGKTTNLIYQGGNNDDSDAQNTSQFTCDLGDESSFVISYNRGISGRGARGAIIQIDNCQSVASAQAKSHTAIHGSSVRTLSISDGQGISVYSGQTSFDSISYSYGHRNNSYNYDFIAQMVANNVYMTEILGTQTGAVGGNVLYLSSFNHPTGSVTFQQKAGTNFCSRGSSCTVGGHKHCVGVAYYPF